METHYTWQNTVALAPLNKWCEETGAQITGWAPCPRPCRSASKPALHSLCMCSSVVMLLCPAALPKHRLNCRVLFVFLSVLDPDRVCSTCIISLGSLMNPHNSWTANKDGEGVWTESKSQFNYYCAPEYVKFYLNRVKTRRSTQISRVSVVQAESSIITRIWATVSLGAQEVFRWLLF